MWGYNSKPVYDCAEHLNGRSTPIWCVRRIKVKRHQPIANFVHNETHTWG